MAMEREVFSQPEEILKEVKEKVSEVKKLMKL